MSHVFEGLQVPAWPATEIENAKRPFARQMLEQRGAVLADVMIAGAFPEIIGVPVVVVERDGRGLGEFVRGEASLRAMFAPQSIMATG